MADPGIPNSGIRADNMRPLAVLRKDNYRAWCSKLKAQLKVNDCWRLVSGTDIEPPATVPAGTGAGGTAAASVLRLAWLKRRDRAAALLITSISDEELPTVQPVDEDPVAIWGRLREKFDRRSEAEAETAQMNLLDFAHREGDSANEMIDRFESVVAICLDQRVSVDENLQKRMLLARPSERYSYLKQNYLLAPVATRPDLVALKAQIRDIDSEYQKSNVGENINKAGQANRAETAWSQGSSGGSSGRGSGRYFNRGGRGDVGRGRSDVGASGNFSNKEATCYCCGKKGHIKPNCDKRGEKCHECGKVGHLQTMCEAAGVRASETGGGEDGKKNFEASQFEGYESFACEVFIGAKEDPTEIEGAQVPMSG